MSVLLNTFKDAAVEVEHLYAVQYLTLAGYTVLLYDVFLTLEREVNIIWTARRWSLVKVAYLLNRYGAIAVAIFYLNFLIPRVNKSDRWLCHRCRNSGSAIMVLDVIIETLGNGIVLYELIGLWGANRRVAWLMCAGFAVLHSATIVSLAIVVVQLKGNFEFFSLSNGLRSCITTINPTAFKGVYIPAVALDIYAFVLLLLNALSRPRSSSQKLLDLLCSDGIVFFLTTFTMRMMCLMTNIVAPTSLSVLALGFASAMVATAVSRLYLRLNLVHWGNIIEQGNIYAVETLLEECELQDQQIKAKK